MAKQCAICGTPTYRDEQPLLSANDEMVFSRAVVDELADLSVCRACHQCKQQATTPGSAGAAHWDELAKRVSDPTLRMFMETFAQTRVVHTQSQEARVNLVVTSGHSFDGYTIYRYIDFVSAETAFGMGYFKSMFANLANITGAESGALDAKLTQARTTAVERLKIKAAQAGANAIIGMALNYTMFGDSIVAVIVSGTAVQIVPATQSAMSAPDLR